MTDIVIAGIGQIPVGEYWDIPLKTLAARAIQDARKESGGLKPQAMYIGNFFGSVISKQTNLGSLLTENVGLEGIEAYTSEAAGASGAAAFRLGYLAVASGFVDIALAVGVEKCTDSSSRSELEAAAAQALDYDYEVVQGITPTSQAALLMQRYLCEYNLPPMALADFPILAHANAINNPNAMYRRPIDRETYKHAGIISEPLNMFDVAPYADGAAAVMLTRPELVPADFPHPLVRVLGSNTTIDALALHDRPDPLAFQAAGFSVERACRKAGISPSEVGLFELDDAFSIYAVLALEAAGFAQRGEGWQLAQNGVLSLKGKLPICTLGGSKGRGNPLGATGVYQIVEAVLQLRDQAGDNQIPDPRYALVQSLGGPATTVITHILERYH